MLEILNVPGKEPVGIIDIPGWDGLTMTKSPYVTGGNGAPFFFPNTSGARADPDYLRIPYQGTPSLSVSPPSTRVTMKFKINKKINPGAFLLWSRYQQRADANSYSVAALEDYTLVFSINNKVVPTSKKITLGEVHEVVTERTGSKVYIYLDGALALNYNIVAGEMYGPATWDWVIGSFLTSTGLIVKPPEVGKWEWSMYDFAVNTY